MEPELPYWTKCHFPVWSCHLYHDIKGETQEQMAPKADKSKSHTHSMHWVMKLRGRRAGSRRKLRKGRGGGAQPPPSLREHSPTGSNPCWGTCSPTSPSNLSWWFQGPRIWPNADLPCPEFELSKKRSSFSKHDEKRKVRNCELSRSDVSNHREETSPVREDDKSYNMKRETRRKMSEAESQRTKISEMEERTVWLYCP